jgi:hypothetical protein
MNAKTLWLGLLLCLSAVGAAAQVRDDAEIRVAAYTLTTNGPEKPASGMLTSWPTTTGRTRSATFSVVACGFVTVRFDQASTFDKAAVAGWRVDITPTKVVDHAVTFRLRWTRALDSMAKGVPPTEDVELTLQPGESRPIDSVPVQPASNPSGGAACVNKAASLRVSVDFPEMDNRLFNADVWLVERLADGTERSQLQSLRGIPHQAIPFYFDRLGDVDLFGHISIEPESTGSVFALEVVRAQVNVPPPADTRGYQAARFDRSTAHVKADEVIEVPLPQLEDQFGPYAKRSFALRIKVRQIR